MILIVVIILEVQHYCIESDFDPMILHTYGNYTCMVYGFVLVFC